jgi:hypothetical protein
MLLEESAKSSNVLNNGDFSTPAKGRFFGSWWAPNNPKPSQKWALDNTRFFMAPPSVKLSNEKGTADMTISQYLPKLKPATRYRLSAYVYFEDVKPIRRGGGIVLNLFDSGNRWYPDNYLTGNSGKWVRQSFEFTSSPTTGTTVTGKKIVPYLRLRIFGATGTVWFDDVTLEEIASK